MEYLPCTLFCYIHVPEPAYVHIRIQLNCWLFQKWWTLHDASQQCN